MFARLFIALILVVAQTASAEEAKEALIELLESVNTFSANFEQRIYQESSPQVDVTLGEFALQKPNKFSWVVLQPYEQRVISDGEMLWNHDPLLEMATYQPMDDGIQQSPALILTQPRKALSSHYDVFKGEAEGRIIFKLVPTVEDSLFQEFVLIFQNDAISEIKILDNLGQETLVAFTEIQTDIELREELFVFVEPPGTEILEQM